MRIWRTSLLGWGGRPRPQPDPRSGLGASGAVQGDRPTQEGGAGSQPAGSRLVSTSGRAEESARCRHECLRHSHRGSALLAVLWVSAALAAIAFSLSTTVRSETDRTSTAVDGLRSYYLASGGVWRATYEVLWSVEHPDKRKLPLGVTHVDYTFPSGDVHVEMVPEAAKLDINRVPPEELYRLGTALGLDPDRAREIALAIVDWRTPSGGGESLDSYYLSLTPSFRPSHASFQEIEELLLVKGVTPDIFYGTYVPADEGDGVPRLSPRTGLIDCLSVFGSRDRLDANTAARPVLAAVGLPPDVINALVARRRISPLTQAQMNELVQAYGASAARLRVEGNSILTIRATARLRLSNGQLSDLRRTVGAQVKYMPIGYDAPIHILRWYDTAWSN